ncbi:MAG: parB-like partition protein [Cyanobacteria bacterium RYN_339]|nr:parB-like partition protein [Cyanobacteria bacterium RYN_339]
MYTPMPGLVGAGDEITFLRYDELPLAEIVPSPHQPRKQMDPLVLASLQESIQAVGVLQRPRVREIAGLYELVFGHQRVQACRLLGWDNLPVEVIRCSDLTARRMTLHENIKSTRLHPIEHAEAICKFIDATLSHDPGYDGLAGETSAARVHQALTLLTTVPQEPDEHATTRAFVKSKEELIRQILREMAGKEPKAFLTADVTLLQLPEEVLMTTLEKGLKKGHAKALGQLLAKEPAMYHDVVAHGVRGDEGEYTPLERAPVGAIRGLYATKKEFKDEPREQDAYNTYIPVGVPARPAEDPDAGGAMPWEDDDEPLSTGFSLPLASLKEAHDALIALSAGEWAAMIAESNANAGVDARRQWFAIRRMSAEVLEALGEG